MASTPFEYELTVPASAIDAMGHVNNVVYVDWVQTAASKHWNAATAPYFKKEISGEEHIGINKIAWVVLDHHITYKAAAIAGDVVVISTFVKTFSGAKSERHTEIKRKRDNQLLASAITNWCLLKMPERKPMRVPQEIIDLY